MLRNLTAVSLAMFLCWPAALALADDDDDGRFIRQLLQRLAALEQRVEVLEGTPDADTLGGLSCTGGQIAKFNGVAWNCAADDVGPDSDTLRDLACGDGEFVSFDANSGRWACTPAPGGGLPVIVMVEANGTPSENCDDLRAVLDSITGSDPTNTIKLAAGDYDCGSTSLTMKTGVDIEGAGPGMTRILGNPEAIPTGSQLAGGVINGATAELRQLTVEHTGGSSSLSFGIDNLGAEMRITDVEVIMTRVGGLSLGIKVVDAVGGAFVKNVRVESNSIGIGVGVIDGFENRATFENVTVIAAEALSGNQGGTVVVRNSILFGSELALRTAGTAFSFFGTQLSGLIDASQGPAPQCTASFDADFQPLDETCGTGLTLTAR